MEHRRGFKDVTGLRASSQRSRGGVVPAAVRGSPSGRQRCRGRDRGAVAHAAEDGLRYSGAGALAGGLGVWVRTTTCLSPTQVAAGAPRMERTSGLDTGSPAAWPAWFTHALHISARPVAHRGPRASTWSFIPTGSRPPGSHRTESQPPLQECVLCGSGKDRACDSLLTLSHREDSRRPWFSCSKKCTIVLFLSR